MSFDFASIPELRLSIGNHARPEDGLCFMELAAYFAGEPHSDRPECACPVLGRYGIGLNDAMPAEERDRLLKPLVPLIVGTRDPASERKRAEFLAMWAINRIVPIAIRAAGFEDHALACERAKTIGEANAASAAALATAYAASAAASAARAAARAAADADAAGAGAAAYAAALATAYAASAAAADAAEVWTIAVEGLRQAILIGRHDGFTDPEPVIIERRENLRELVHCGRETNR